MAAKLPLEKLQALEAAIRLEEMLRVISGEPQTRASLRSLAYRFRREFTSYAELKSVIWIRHDIAHGLDQSSLEDWNRAIRVLEQAIGDIQPKYSLTNHDIIQKIKLRAAKRVAAEPYDPEEDPMLEVDTMSGVSSGSIRCPVCDGLLDVDPGDLEDGDSIFCDECGCDVRVLHVDPLQLVSIDEDDDEDGESEEAVRDWE
jgi:alpha-aminoadipate carrier protein LysW